MPSSSLRSARDCSITLKYHLFQTCLRSTVGHHHSLPSSYGRTTKSTKASVRRKRRCLLTGQSGSCIRRRQRTSPHMTLCQVGGSTIFSHHLRSAPVPVPTQAEIISDFLLSEGVSTSTLLGDLNTWITTPVDEFPDLYPMYVALIERLSGEETKGDTPYTQLSPGDFRRLSPTRQIGEFRTLGVDAHTDKEVLKILLGPTPATPDDTYVLPTASVVDLPLLDILHHERHLGKHIRRMAERRGEYIRQASRLTRSTGSPSSREKSFREKVVSIQQLTRNLEDQRRLHLLLTNRRKALLRHLRHRPPVTLTIPNSTLDELSHPNYYDSLIDEVDPLPPAGGTHSETENTPLELHTDTEPDPARGWSPRRTRYSRAPKPPATEMSPMDTTLAHAEDLNRSAPPSSHSCPPSSRPWAILSHWRFQDRTSIHDLSTTGCYLPQCRRATCHQTSLHPGVHENHEHGCSHLLRCQTDGQGRTSTGATNQVRLRPLLQSPLHYTLQVSTFQTIQVMSTCRRILLHCQRAMGTEPTHMQK